MTPRISIIVPCYNEKRMIGMLLQAIHQQTYPLADMEVIISDGLSNDGTREVIRAFSETHPELHIRDLRLYSYQYLRTYR